MANTSLPGRLVDVERHATAIAMEVGALQAFLGSSFSGRNAERRARFMASQFQSLDDFLDDDVCALLDDVNDRAAMVGKTAGFSHVTAIYTLSKGVLFSLIPARPRLLEEEEEKDGPLFDCGPEGEIASAWDKEGDAAYLAEMLRGYSEGVTLINIYKEIKVALKKLGFRVEDDEVVPITSKSAPQTTGSRSIGANTSRLFSSKMPDDPRIERLVALLDNEKSKPKEDQRSWNAIAREITGENVKSCPRAKSLLSNLNRLRRKGRVTLDP